ncbi:MAG: hypothetical protein CM1200mP14_01050 [Gammaproteobacteria bacterium]|nr:MAG: hypothetical protein CM1200mP14_01050 [Gammaproteobacteria bacterium]
MSLLAGIMVLCTVFSVMPEAASEMWEQVMRD